MTRSRPDLRRYYLDFGRWLRVYRSDVGEGGDTYMQRWIVRLPFGMVRLHRIMRSDKVRDLHDHPFSFVSVVLWGGYWEVRPASGRTDDFGYVWMHTWVERLLVKVFGPGPRDMVDFDLPVTLWRGPGSIAYRPAEAFHRVEVPEGSSAWTLVFGGLPRRQWGFQTSKGWVSAEDYEKVVPGSTLVPVSLR